MDTGKVGIAEQYLRMLREDHAKVIRSDKYYITLAANAGVSPDRIAILTGLPVEHVNAVIRGAA